MARKIGAAIEPRAKALDEANALRDKACYHLDEAKAAAIALRDFDTSALEAGDVADIPDALADITEKAAEVAAEIPAE